MSPDITSMSQCPLRFAAACYPKTLGLEDDDHAWTFTKFDQKVAERCQELSTAGIRPGHPVPFVAPHSANTAIHLLALIRLGAVACPLSPHLPPSAQGSAIRRLPTHSVSQTTDEDPHRIATILLTSGTTSTPKMAVHSLDNYLYSALGAVDALELLPGDRWHVSLPLYHVSGIGILFRCLLRGATILFHRNWRTARPTHLSFVPTQLHRLLEEQPPLIATQHLRCILLGGAPLSKSIYTKALERGCPLCTSWGMTETTALVTLGHHRDQACGGQVLPYREVHIAPDQEIWVRGDTLFRGYWDKGELSSPLSTHGWFPTRDLGQWDDRGNVHWLGRKDNLFVSGGENIQPEEIEAVLCESPAISEALVVPLPDTEFGMRPAAFIRSYHTPVPTPALVEFLTHRLPRYKIPRYFFPFPADEATAPLKRDRNAFRQLAVTYASVRHQVMPITDRDFCG